MMPSILEIMNPKANNIAMRYLFRSLLDFCLHTFQLYVNDVEGIPVKKSVRKLAFYISSLLGDGNKQKILPCLIRADKDQPC